MKNLGVWWADRSIEIVEIDGKAVALDGWNGERYLKCFEVFNYYCGRYFECKDEEFEVVPVYSDPDEDGNVEIIDYREAV